MQDMRTYPPYHTADCHPYPADIVESLVEIIEAVVGQKNCCNCHPEPETGHICEYCRAKLYLSDLKHSNKVRYRVHNSPLQASKSEEGP